MTNLVVTFADYRELTAEDEKGKASISLGDVGGFLGDVGGFLGDVGDVLA